MFASVLTILTSTERERKGKGNTGKGASTGTATAFNVSQIKEGGAGKSSGEVWQTGVPRLVVTLRKGGVLGDYMFVFLHAPGPDLGNFWG